MKTIAVLVHNILNEYASTVVEGIHDYFKGRSDIRLIVSSTRSPHFAEGSFEYQYWADAEYLKSECVDAVIVVTNSYPRLDLLQDCIYQGFKTQNIVSVEIDPGLENVVYSKSSPASAYRKIISHLKNEHDCKKIGFVSANLVGSQEAFERFDAFKDALEENNLQFEESFIFHSNFTRYKTLEVLKERIKSKSDVHFDAMVCANDLMATGVIEYLEQLGLKIPEDVCVFGFDNTSHATACNPPLSTVDQQIFEKGKITAKMADDLLKGEKVEKVVEVPLKVIYRESCGCVQAHSGNNALRNQLSYYSDLTKTDKLLDLINRNQSLKNFAESFLPYMSIASFDGMWCFVSEHPIPLLKEQDFVVPEAARLMLEIDVRKDIAKYYQNGTLVNPKKQLFPDDLLSEGSFIFQPLYLGEIQYGYIICRTSNTSFAANGINTKLLNTIVAQNYEYTLAIKQNELLEQRNNVLLEKNSNLNLQSKTDELTKLFNRRGFLQYGQKVIDISVEMDGIGLVFFADLDGLKKINDTYGHEYGDLAIQTQAQVLKKAFRQTDVVGRLSGDEFAIVAPGMTIENLIPMRNKLKLFDEQFSKENNLPFTISISLGAVSYEDEEVTLEDLLKKADAVLYEEKQVKHAKR